MALNTFGYSFVDTVMTGVATNPETNDVVVPDDASFSVPVLCPGTFEYSPGVRYQYHDYTEFFMGAPMVTLKWTDAIETDVKQIRTDYQNSLNGTSRGRCFIYWPNGETGNFQVNAAYMEQPQQEGYEGGVLSKGFTLSFTKLGFELNSAFTSRIPVTDPNNRFKTDVFNDIETGQLYEYGNSQYAVNSWTF